MYSAVKLGVAALMAAASMGALAAGPARAEEFALNADLATDPAAALAEAKAALAATRDPLGQVTILAQQAAIEAKLDRLDDADRTLARARALLPARMRTASADGARANLLLAQANVFSQRQSEASALTAATAAHDLLVKLHGADSLEAAYAEIVMGRIEISLSKLDEGLAHTGHAWERYEQVRPAGDPDRFDAAFQYARGLSNARHAAEAEVLLRRLADELPLLPARQPYRAMLPNTLGIELLMQGRLNEAVPWLRQSVDTGEQVRTQTIGERADNIAVLGAALLMQDRPDDAQPFFERAATMFREAQALPSAAGSLLSAGTAADRAGDRARGLELRQQAVDLIMTVPGQGELALALQQFKLAQSLAHAGRLEEAETLAGQAAGVLTTARPERQFQNTNSRISLGWIKALNGKPAEGLAEVQRAFRTSVDTNNRLEVSRNRVVGVLENVEAYSQALETAVLADDKAFAFEVLQVMVETDASRAAVAVTAREQAGDSALGSLLRQRQETAGKVEDADAALLKAQGLEDGAGTAPAKAALASARTALAALDADLDQRFPAFRNLLRPRPVTLAETQARLGPNDLGVYTMVITRAGVAIGHSPVRRQALRALVRRVRAGTIAGADTPFDTAAAAELGRAIFTPEVARLAPPGTHLRIVTGDILSALPLSLLVTREGKTLADTRWLIEDHPLSVLPSLAALTPGTAMKNGAAKRFVAIGAPALSGTAALAAGPEYFAPGTFRTAHLSDLPPLPGAAREIVSVARLLARKGGLPPEILTGAAATEPAVRALDFTNVGVLLLATHGLVAGAFDAQSEPALVLTPPTLASLPPESNADGLLTASEAATLHIDADWVILSACDTAAGNYPSAAGYTGLARAFLFAGARRVVASHWPVRDDVAARLTVGLVEAARKGAASDVALQQAILGVMHDPKLPNARNPALWAPFMVVAR